MSGSCYNKIALPTLKVGKIYCSSTDSKFKIKITKQWNCNLFEGEHCCRGWEFLFSSTGTCLGFPGHNGSVLSWYLTEIMEYEYKLVFSNYVSNNWSPCIKSSGSVVNAFYLVREKDKHETIKLLSFSEMKEFINEIFASKD